MITEELTVKDQMNSLQECCCKKRNFQHAGTEKQRAISVGATRAERAKLTMLAVMNTRSAMPKIV